MLIQYLLGWNEFLPDKQMYSCANTEDHRYPNVGIGILYLTLGIFYQICYVPCIIVMARDSLSNMPCFKIMVFLGVVDVLCLFICADLAGIWSITGQRFCASPTLAFVLGSLSMGFWGATCLCCIILAVNRATDLVFPRLNHVFEGRRIYFWLLLPSLYFTFFTFFERPLLFDPVTSSFFFDPFTNYSGGLSSDNIHKIYANVPHTVNNVVVILSLVTCYLIICVRLIHRVYCNHVIQLNTMTRQIILQLLIICGCHIVGCFLYVYTQYFPVPQVFTVIGNLAWMGNHGLPGVVYLTLNNTIRHNVLVLLGLRKARKIKTIGPTSLSTNMAQVTL